MMNSVSSVRQLNRMSEMNRSADIEATALNLSDEREMLLSRDIRPSGNTRRRLLENNRRAFKRLLKNASHFDLSHVVLNVKAKRSNV